MTSELGLFSEHYGCLTLHRWADPLVLFAARDETLLCGWDAFFAICFNASIVWLLVCLEHHNLASMWNDAPVTERGQSRITETLMQWD